MNEILDPDNPLQFFIGFVCLWIIVSALISYLGGWWALSQYYLSKPHSVRKKWLFQSAAMRFMTSYGNCLNVGVTDRGLLLSVLFLFRFGHPPLLIPWEDIKLEKYSSWMMKGVRLNFSKVPNVPLYLREKLVRKINDEIDGKWNEIFI